MSSSGFRDQHFYGSYLGWNTQKKVRSATARADFSCLGSRHSSWLKLKHNNICAKTECQPQQKTEHDY